MRRRCVFTSAGDYNQVMSWLGADGRSWDLILVYYGDDPKFAKDLQSVSDKFFTRKGSKWQNLHAVLAEEPSLLSAYEYVWVTDDDIHIDPTEIDRLFDIAEKSKFWVSQPAFDPKGKVSHKITAFKGGDQLYRVVNFVENTCPLFMREKLEYFMSIYDGSVEGWGVDYWYCHVLESERLHNFAVIDAIRVVNPPNSSKSGRREMDKVAPTPVRRANWIRVRDRLGIPEVVPNNIRKELDATVERQTAPYDIAAAAERSDAEKRYSDQLDDRLVGFQPWQKNRRNDTEQVAIKSVLSSRCGGKFGAGSYVARDAIVMTDSLSLGDQSYIAAGAIVRGRVEIGRSSTINAYAHIAGKVAIGNGVRIGGHTSIYGFNHGYARIDVPIYKQPLTAKGIVIRDGSWIGANCVIVDGVTIGVNCIVGAGATVTRDVPDNAVVAGVPARIVKYRSKEETKAMMTETEQARMKHPLFVRSTLYDTDPYVDPPVVFDLDLQGWDSKAPIFRNVISEIRPALIVEVGTWKGASAVHMASVCKDLQIATEIVCVDTWLGNWQHWARESGIGSRTDLKIKNGMPRLYYQFLSNVKAMGMDDMITPVPLTGVAAAKLFKELKLSPSVVYIDGDHEYESVRFDLALWLDVLAPDGVLIGDDYDWPGVRRAAREIVQKGGFELKVEHKKFTLRRPGTTTVS